MTKILVIAAGLMFVKSIQAQESSKASFYPLKVGQEKTLTWYTSQYRESISDSVTIDRNTYYIVSKENISFRQNLMLRAANDTVYRYDEKLQKEVPFFGVKPQVGLQVGDGTVTGVNQKLKTSKRTLKHLLEIDMKYEFGHHETLYLQKGVGLVAAKHSNGYICYLLTD